MARLRNGFYGILLLAFSTGAFAQKPLYTEQAGSVEASKAPIARVAFSPTAGLLAAVSTDNFVRLFDLATLKARVSLPDLTSRVTALAFSTSGQSLVTGAADGQISVWNAPQGTPVQTFSVHSGGVTAVAVQDENLLFTIGVDHTLHVTDMLSGNSIGSMNAENDDYTALALHGGGKIFATGTASGQIQICTVAQLAPLKTLTDLKTAVSGLVFSPDRKLLAACAVGGNIALYETENFILKKLIAAHKLPIASLTFDPKSRWLVSSSSDSTVQIFDVPSGESVATLTEHNGYGTYAGFVDDKTLLVATTKGMLKTWTVLPEPPDTTPPVIVLEQMKTGADSPPVKTFGSEYEVRGIAYDNSDIAEASLNGRLLSLTPVTADAASKVPPGMKGKQFRTILQLDSVGINPVTLKATDPYGLSTSVQAFVQRLTGDQAVELTFPSVNAETGSTTTPIKFRAWFDIASYSISVNLSDIVNAQVPYMKGPGDEISEEVPLVVGYNQIQLSVLSAAGDRITKTIGITRTSSAASTPTAFAPSAKRDRSSGPEAWAVVVGVSEYANPAIPALKYADRDAEAFANFLRRPEGGGYDADHLCLLLNKDATLPNLRNALINFLNQAIDIDLVIIYFAGHGAPEPARPQLLYLLTYDSDPTVLGTTAFPMWQIQDVLARYINAKRIVVFSDACHSGGISVNFATRGLGATEQNLINQYLTDLSKTKEGTVVFTASAAGEVSQEFPELGHGVFTYYLLEGMQGKADYNNDYTVTINELMQYVEVQVKSKTRGAQNPTRSQTAYDKEMTISTIPH